MAREKEHYRVELDRLAAQFPGREVINLDEAARLLGCSKDTLLRSPKFPKRKLGHRWIVPLVSLASYLT